VNKRLLIAIGVLAAATTLAHGEEAARTDPESGKSCVTFLSAGRTDTGMVHMNFRNICNRAFEIRILTGDKPRKGNIKAGTPKKPSSSHVTCRSEDRCDAVEWEFE